MAGTQPLFKTLTITRPWGQLRESMPRPLAFRPPPAIPSCRGTWGLLEILWEMDEVGGPHSFPPAVP